MVIDDDTDTLMLLKNIFQKSGLEVFTSATGNNAVEKAEKYHPDVLLLDVNLDYPYDGRKICEQLRDNEKTKDIKIFLCSAQYRDDKKAVFREDGFIPKPFDLVQLENAILPAALRKHE